MYHEQLNQMKENFKQTDLICIVDKKGNILYYNNYNDVCNKLGSNDVIGMPLLEVYPWLSNETSTVLKVIEKGEPIVNELQCYEVNKSFTVNAINSAFPLKNKSDLLGAVIVSTNLDEKPHKMKKNSKINKDALASLCAKYTFNDIVTVSEELKLTKNQLKKAALKDSNILIYGETGTGKELFAHSIHNDSSRKNSPLVAQNCAAIPSTLIESILFGTTKGSFTGAEDKQGIFEIADGGTIFLDEINSMPIEMQVKLLRVIEERTVRRIGDHRDIPINVRVIASTNENPLNLLKEKRFREDLFFRLNVVSVEIPPLRKRKEDIDYLCSYFINYYNQAFGENITGLDSDARKILNNYGWPGNVRELRNCIEGAFNLVDGSIITPRELPTHILALEEDAPIEKLSDESSLMDLVEQYEKEILKDALVKTHFNIAKAARLLKIPRQSFYNKMKKYKLQT